MVLNPGKCHCMLIGNHDESDKINLKTEITINNYKNSLVCALIKN